MFRFIGIIDCKLKSLKLQQQIYCPEEKELTKAEYARLIHTAKQKGNERLNLVIQTICGTGIRVSELQFITVEAVEKSEAVVSLKGKTRTVFIVKDLQKIAPTIIHKIAVDTDPVLKAFERTKQKIPTD